VNPWLESVYRSCPAAVQNAILGAYGLKLRRERFNPRYHEWTRAMERSERFSREELESYQDDCLRRLVRHAYEKVPYYRKVMTDRRLGPDDFRSQRDLHKLPVLSKDMIRKRGRELLADGVSPGSLKSSPTSGTTGSPLEVLWDREQDVLWNVLIWRHRRWAGIEFGDRYGTLLGRVVVPPGRSRPPFWRRNRAWSQTFFSSFHLAPGNATAYLDEIRRSGIVAMEAYPSTAYILALAMEKAGRRHPLKAFFTSSEPLLEAQRELIEDRFQTKVFDYYGMSEAVMFAGECPAHEGHHHHAEASVVEVLDGDGEPVPDGQVGRLVGTTLHNLAMPLIRYEVGDLTTRMTRSCSCGRAHPLFTAVTTKAEDIIVTPDGRLVSPSVITHPFKPLKGLAMSQIIQEDLRRVRVLLVLEGSAPDRLLAELREGLKSRLGSGMDITIETVKEIPRGPTGKYRWIISKVPLDHKLAPGGNLYSRREPDGAAST
jgi:phenylacetate-CoA ligase